MKKLGKFEISSNKIMKNEELIILKGGYDEGCCKCTDGYAMVALSKQDCEDSCSAYGQHGVWSC